MKASQMVTDGRPEQLRREVDESLRRLGTDRVELLYLHSPDQNDTNRRIGRAHSANCWTQARHSPSALRTARSSNSKPFTPFAPSPPCNCPTTCCSATSNSARFRGAAQNNIAVMVYWPLMKGLLAGKLPRDRLA